MLKKLVLNISNKKNFTVKLKKKFIILNSRIIDLKKKGIKHAFLFNFIRHFDNF